MLIIINERKEFFRKGILVLKILMKMCLVINWVSFDGRRVIGDEVFLFFFNFNYFFLCLVSYVLKLY